MYTYKGNTYDAITEARMKNPTTRAWETCVIYKSMDTQEVYVREKEEFYKLFQLMDMKIPYHIQIMSGLVNVVTGDDNQATGEIRKFQTSDVLPRRAKVVSIEVVNNEDHDALWVHIANSYFKMVGLWPSTYQF